MAKTAAALGAHPFEPSDQATRLDRAGRPIRTCRVCGRPGRGSGHRFGGLTPTPPALRVVGKSDAQRERRGPTPLPPAIAERLAPSLAVAGAPVIAAGRHAFEPDPGGQTVRTKGAAKGTSATWLACAVCGKDRRAHPRRTPAQMAAAAAPSAAPELVRADPPPESATAVRTQRAASKLPAAELVALAIGVDRILALPVDAVGWKLRVRLTAVRELLRVPVYPTMDVAEVGQADPAPPDRELVARIPELRQRSVPVASDAQTQRLIRGIRDDRTKVLARRAVAAGGSLSMTGSGHLAIDLGSQRIIVSTTQNGGRRGHSWGNVRATAKRAGIDVSGI
jgi:hypothetical protein